MSNEQFDKQIKRKLESVRPAYEEAAWKKLQAALPVPWYLSFLRDFGGWILGGVATTAFLGSLYFYYEQKQANEKLHEEIVILKENQHVAKTSDTVYINTNHTDTVYVVKTIREVVEVPVYSEKHSNQVVANEPTSSSNKKQSQQTNGTTTAEKTAVQSNKANVTNTLEPNESAHLVANPAPSTNKSIAAENEAETTKTPSPIQHEDKVVNYIRDTPELTKEKVEIENKVPVSDILIPERKPETAEEKKKKAFKLPYIHTRVGVASDYIGLRIFSIGPSVEAFITNNLSLSTGLFIAKPQEIQYGQPADYNRETGKRFEDQFDGKVPPQHRIEDIHIETSFINLPISMTYYIPTRSNFTFMVNAGTKLNLSVYQQVEFESSLMGETEKNSFEAHPQPQVFNSLYYGMGVQYQYKRVVAQLMPYFDFRFRQSDYLQTPRNYGIMGSLKFDFGK